MFRVRSIAIRFLNLFRGRRLDNDLREQMDSHAEMLEDEFVHRGMSHEEAKAAARRAIGKGPRVREVARDAYSFRIVETIVADLRLAARRLAKRPGLTGLAVVALAVGIGAAAAGWSLVSAVTLNPLPLVDTDGLYVVDRPRIADPGFDFIQTSPQSFPHYVWLRDQPVFSRVAAGSGLGTFEIVATETGGVIDATLYLASFGFFETLGVDMALGRAFSFEDDRPGAPAVAILSHALWRRDFGEDPGVIGQTIRVGNVAAVLIGVAPRGFDGIQVGDDADLYLPLRSAGQSFRPAEWFAEVDDDDPYASAWLTVVVRLANGGDPDHAAAFLEELHPDPLSQQQWALMDMNTAALPWRSREGMAEFSAFFGPTVGMLLVIACLAVGMLLLVRTEARREEFAMCLALGAGRGRIARSIAFEGVWLAVLGASLAVPIASVLLNAIRGFQLPGRFPVDALDLSVDFRVLVASVFGASGALIVLSLVACFLGWSASAIHTVCVRPGATPRHTRYSLRSGLVVGQVAVALLLLVGMGLFARSLLAALSTNPDDADRLVFASVSLESDRYSPGQVEALYARLAERLRARRDVEAVTVATPVIMRAAGGPLEVDGVVRPLPAPLGERFVESSYFRTLQAEVVSGRLFTDSDGFTAPRVAIVSEALGRIIAGNESPLGKRVHIYYASEPFEIVGVVRELVQSIHDVEPLTVYVPISQITNRIGSGRTVVVRSSGADVTPVFRALAAEIEEEDGGGARIQSMSTLDEQLLSQMPGQQLGVVVMGGLASIAVLLTVVSVYVLAETLAAGRRREAGIRSALGASGWQLSRIVLSDCIHLVGLGVAVGIGLAWTSGNVIESLLFGVEPMDPFTLVATSLGILLLAAMACLRPSVAAMRVDPARTLREE